MALAHSVPQPSPAPPHGSNVPRPGLHIPDACARPGDQPDFSQLHVGTAGSVRKPAVDAAAATMRELAFDLIRVLSDDHRAVGPWDPKLSPASLRRGLKLMMTQRSLDERMEAMQRQGRLSFYVKSSGEEAVAIAQGMALEDRDILFPSYRQPGLQLVRGRSVVDMMCQYITNSRDNNKGRQIPGHYNWNEGNFVSVSSPVGTQFPQAVGCAMASASRGEDTVTATWIGDGATAEGDFHNAIVFAAAYRPPVILNVVNNQWAISTPQSFASGSATFAARGLGYDIPSLRVDGNDFPALFSVTAWAAERARRGGGPSLIEVFTYRAGPHSTSDDPSGYRPRDEAAHWPLGDPIERLKTHLIQRGEWSQSRHTQLQAQLKAEMSALYKEAESYGTLKDGPLAPKSTLFDDVYKALPPHLRKQRQAFGY